jgi:hypothetical protein
MLTRTRSRCDALVRPRPERPARRAACRTPVVEFAERMYIAIGEEDGTTSIDVLERGGAFVARFVVADRAAAAEALLRDATGHAPRPATRDAFAGELLAGVEEDGLAITSGEVCAWLLLRAIS